MRKAEAQQSHRTCQGHGVENGGAAGGLTRGPVSWVTTLLTDLSPQGFSQLALGRASGGFQKRVHLGSTCQRWWFDWTWAGPRHRDLF